MARFARHVTARVIPALLLLSVVAVSSTADAQAILSRKDRFHPIAAKNAIVATQNALATRVGVDILKRGGNAVDAAVAVGFALAVTLPRAGNLGGGGFMLVHSAKTGKTVALDYREMAPAAAHRDMYLKKNGEVDKKKARYSYHSVGVPGSVAGFALALERYGTMSLKDVMAPAIRLAEQGITVSRFLSRGLAGRKKRLLKWPETKRVFFKADGSAPEPGEKLVQKDLAWSLKQIAEEGPKAFYEGAVAGKIVADMKANGGPITMDDLRNYKAVIREPVRGTYRGHEIVSMPPPSSGGVHIVQILNVLEGYAIGAMGHNSAKTIHLMAEAMKFAYADRSEHLGDPDFWKVPVKGLTSKTYAAALRARIRTDTAASANEIKPGNPAPYESGETTHFSIIDKDGNVVASTNTLNFGFGTGIVAAGTGILLNNEMDDFSAKPGVANAYGLIGGEANRIEPGKRPLSSMSPTIVIRDGEPFLATGSPGGSRIITTTLQVIMNVIDHKMNLAAATAAPRIHHQWLPDRLRIERGLSPDTIAILEGYGHEVKTQNAMGSTQSVMKVGKDLYGASDPRRPGALTLGY